MQQRHDPWMPVSPVTARLWALEAMADAAARRRRRLAPAMRRLARATTRRLGGRQVSGRPQRRVARPRVSLARSDTVSD